MARCLQPHRGVLTARAASLTGQQLVASVLHRHRSGRVRLARVRAQAAAASEPPAEGAPQPAAATQEISKPPSAKRAPRSSRRDPYQKHALLNRIRQSFVFTAWHRFVEIVTLPLELLRHLLYPVWVRFEDSYNSWSWDETRRQWKFERMREQEFDFWFAIWRFIIVALVTAAWEAVVPASILLAIVVPMYMAWLFYDRFWISPVFICLYVMLPLKFGPGAPFQWI